MLALVDNEPRILNLKQVLRVYLDHRLVVIRRRSEHELQRAQERAHILEGLLKALDNLDETIAIIRKSRNVQTARTNLRKALQNQRDSGPGHSRHATAATGCAGTPQDR